LRTDSGSDGRACPHRRRRAAGLSAAIALLQAAAGNVDIVEITEGDGVIESELLLAGQMLRILYTLPVAGRCAASGVGIDRGVH